MFIASHLAVAGKYIYKYNKMIGACQELTTRQEGKERIGQLGNCNQPGF